MIPTEYDEVMYREGSQKRVVHIPDGDRPLCTTDSDLTVTQRKKRWVRKNSTVIPDGHYPDCQYCIEIVR